MPKSSEETRRHHWVVGEEEAQRRLDHFLVATGELGTRSQIRKLIADGLVRVDGKPAKAGAALRVGQEIDAEQPPPESHELRAEAIDIGVLFEDDYLIAIDKPAGLVVHPAPGHWSGTLVNALLHRWQGKRRDLDPMRCGIVHRLDKDTSGVILVAKDLETHAALEGAFRRREVRKRYRAIIHGAPSDDAGEIDAPIGRHPVERKKMAIRRGGRSSQTRFEVVERYRGAAMVRVFPHTGRTHQIRVHLASIGHPIVADPVYAKGRRLAMPVIERQALHAERLRLSHPVSGVGLDLKAPLPADFVAAVESLRAAAEG